MTLTTGVRADAERHALSVLASLGLGDLSGRRSSQLSGGQQQRVSIARAVANDPRLILADEPTGNLDSKNGVVVMEVFEKLVFEQGITVVMVTHDPTAASYAGHVLLFADGKVAGHVTDPTPDAVLAGLDALAGVER